MICRICDNSENNEKFKIKEILDLGYATGDYYRNLH